MYKFAFYSITNRQKDINECEANHDGANSSPMCSGQKQSCLNTIGSYKCMCNRGFEKTGKNLHICFIKEIFQADSQCGDVNECDESMHSCPILSTCQNSIGSYTCQPITGAECSHNMLGSVKVWECHDIDQCAANNNCPVGISTCVDSLKGNRQIRPTDNAIDYL